MNRNFCPNCFSEYEVVPDACKCGYPFAGSENEKSEFIANSIKNERVVKEGIKGVSYARYILFIIGGINLIISLILTLSENSNSLYFLTVIYSIILIGLGFYSYKEPFFALLVGFIVLLFLYGTMGYLNPHQLLSGLVTKVIFITIFAVGLYKVKQAENIRKLNK